MPAGMAGAESAASPTPIVSAFGYKLSPEYRTITNAVITEATYDREAGTYSGAVYDHSGALVIESVRPAAMVKGFRSSDSISVDRSRYSKAPSIPEAIYGGHHFFVWGHFLIETLSTAVLAPRLPDVPVIFTPFQFPRKGPLAEKFFAHSLPLLRAAGWGSREILVTDDAIQVERLHVPQRLTAFGARSAGNSMHPDMDKVYERIRSTLGTPRQSARQIVVMRDKSHRRWHPSEDDIYRALIQRGYEAVHPERMSALDQVAVLSSASCIVGFSGSCLHNSVFLQPNSCVIEIGDDARRNGALATQIDLCQTCRQHHRFVPGFDPSPRACSSIVENVLEAATMAA